MISINFQDLCELNVGNKSIVLKDDVISGDVKSNDDCINNALGIIFLKKYEKQSEDKPQDYALSDVRLGSGIYHKIRMYFNIENGEDIFCYKIFDLLTIEDKSLQPYEIKFDYTWTMFEMGSK